MHKRLFQKRGRVHGCGTSSRFLLPVCLSSEKLMMIDAFFTYINMVRQAPHGIGPGDVAQCVV